MDGFEVLIEKAKVDSKHNFLRFIKGIYNVDECVFKHLFDVPIIASYQDDLRIIIPLSTKKEEDILEEIDEFIDGKLEKKDSCFIYLDEIANIFEYEEIEEWESKFNNGEFSKDYNAIIVYNEMKLKKDLRQLVSITQKESEEMFTKYLTDIIACEMCQLNANYFPYGKNNIQLDNIEYGKKELVDILALMIGSYQEGDTVLDCLYKVIKEKRRI